MQKAYTRVNRSGEPYGFVVHKNTKPRGNYQPITTPLCCEVVVTTAIPTLTTPATQVWHWIFTAVTLDGSAISHDVPGDAAVDTAAALATAMNTQMGAFGDFAVSGTNMVFTGNTAMIKSATLAITVV